MPSLAARVKLIYAFLIRLPDPALSRIQAPCCRCGATSCAHRHAARLRAACQRTSLARIRRAGALWRSHMCLRLSYRKNASHPLGRGSRQ
jgi:hypothetical protein